MKQLYSQLKYQLLVLSRNNLITISIAVTLIYTLIFYFIKNLPNTDKFLTLLIFNDPVIICFFFVGISIIMEKDQGILPALFISPLNHHAYLVAKVLALTLIGLACSFGMTVAMLGINLSWFPFFMGIAGTCIICGLAGIFVMSFADEFLQFTLRSIPLMIFLSLPLLNYFNLTESGLFTLTPMHSPLELLISSYGSALQLKTILIHIIITICWIVLIYYVVYKTFEKRVIKAAK